MGAHVLSRWNGTGLVGRLVALELLEQLCQAQSGWATISNQRSRGTPNAVRVREREQRAAGGLDGGAGHHAQPARRLHLVI